jgi:hypothetical protein
VKEVPIETVFWSVWVAILLTIVCCALFDTYITSSGKPPQRYTVHFDGIDYQDLERIGLSSEFRVYKTKAGKRIEFHGSFYEVTQ